MMKNIDTYIFVRKWLLTRHCHTIRDYLDLYICLAKTIQNECVFLYILNSYVYVHFFLKYSLFYSLLYFYWLFCYYLICVVSLQLSSQSSYDIFTTRISKFSTIDKACGGQICISKELKLFQTAVLDFLFLLLLFTYKIINIMGLRKKKHFFFY